MGTGIEYWWYDYKDINKIKAFAYFIGYKYIHIKQSYNVYENNNDVA